MIQLMVIQPICLRHTLIDFIMTTNMMYNYLCSSLIVFRSGFYRLCLLTCTPNNNNNKYNYSIYSQQLKQVTSAKYL